MSLYPHVRFLLSVDRLEQLPPDDGSEVAFAGRSNAGKSSAINAIVQRRNLARSSKTPGRTQLVNMFELAAQQRLADLPGYGYAKVPPALQLHWQRLVGDYLQGRRSLGGLMLVVDARRGLADDEGMLLQWARSRSLAVRVLLSKCDKLKRAGQHGALQAAEAWLDGAATVQLFSAVSRQGVPEAQEALSDMMKKSPGGA